MNFRIFPTVNHSGGAFMNKQDINWRKLPCTHKYLASSTVALYKLPKTKMDVLFGISPRSNDSFTEQITSTILEQNCSFSNLISPKIILRL